MRHSTAEAKPGNAGSSPEPTYLPVKIKAQLLRRLVAGFIVILSLLGLDGLVGFFGAQAVRDGISSLTAQQTKTMANVDELQRLVSVFQSVEYRLIANPTKPGRAGLEPEIASAEKELESLFAKVPANDPDISVWQDLHVASSSVIAAMRSALASPTASSDVKSLVQAHQTLSNQIQRLSMLSHQRVEITQRWIESATLRQAIEDRVLLAACLLVSSLFLWTSTRIYYRMSQQSEELNQVSWQLLEKQELLAQRLSRELHDELGQSLTALKTNLSRHAAKGCTDALWMQDCTGLLKESIRSAHEISQLLRPTVLDDFGLDSALSWLCERFEERHGIKVKYASDYQWRLDEQAETHVFRIAQEALTNVARHSEASQVDVMFSKQYGVVRLKIKDNGVGLKPRTTDGLPSLGLTGMRARARSLDGEVHIQSEAGKGVAIELIFKAKPHV